ncbi:hypothetical protein O6H91_05G035400 [Diphasiastrum complanatum]|uniref:Uncharacterized protein n=1 Tax=Diphasiastrum complanatum TaxID=34168 RepID=A0ACC2DMC4_DIPCM|nr:hypothetical protein O6H91_05G035400 [Diphasiastrum complanatum]
MRMQIMMRLSRDGAPAFGLLLLLVLSMLMLLGCIWPQPCNALYEDQVGMWDWYQQYIGKVTHAVFQTQGTGRKRVLVATDENVIASLNLRKGEILWRHALGETESINALEIAAGKYAVTLSAGCNLRAWNLPDGTLIWETHLQTAASAVKLLILSTDINNDRTNDLLVVGGGLVQAISSVDGRLLWTADLADVGSGGFLPQETSVADKEHKLYALGFVGSSKLGVAEIDLSTGAKTQYKEAELPEGFPISDLLAVGESVVALDLAGSSIVSGTFTGKEKITLELTPVSSIYHDVSGNAQLLSLKARGVFVISFKDEVIVVGVDSETGKLDLVEKFNQPIAISNTLALSDEKQAIALVQHMDSDQTILLRVIITDGWKDEIAKDVIKLEPQRGLLQTIFLNSYTRTDKSHGFRALVVAEDDSLSLLQQGEVVWSREDGLASILDARMAELPLERAGVSVAQVEHSLEEWLKGHVLRLKSTLMLASAEDVVALQAVRLKNAEKTKMTRDHNGFRKLIILLTKSGKLFALHSGDGHVVWSLLIPALRSEHRTPKPEPVKLLPWRKPHQHALDDSPVFLVVGRLGPGPNAPGVLSWVDAYSGRELHSLKLTYPIKQVLPLPILDSLEQRLHLFVDGETNVHLFPNTAESLSLFNNQSQNVYFYDVNKDEGVIKGFRITDHIEDFVFSTRLLWSVVFPSDSEAIATTATRNSDEVVHTQAKVLGDRNVLFKYLNKNIVFVTTVAPGPSSKVGLAAPEDSWLVAYLIDTITGQVLHRVTHQDVQGPVHAVLSENWVIYHYFNLRAHRYELTVMEFYDNSRAETKGVLQYIIGRHNASAPFSSYTYPNIDVKSQSYFFTSSVKKMAVTMTARGITSRQLLIGTNCDQVLALDKRFLDPRRSINPTAMEREEGILPLTDGLPIYPQSYVTHSYRLEGLRGILSVPARLESPSLVFAYGLDLFYTRLAPSRTYDSLTEDFSYALLLITMIVLVVAIGVSWVMSKRKELADKWK